MVDGSYISRLCAYCATYYAYTSIRLYTFFGYKKGTFFGYKKGLKVYVVDIFSIIHLNCRFKFLSICFNRATQMVSV